MSVTELPPQSFIQTLSLKPQDTRVRVRVRTDNTRGTRSKQGGRIGISTRSLASARASDAPTRLRGAARVLRAGGDRAGDGLERFDGGALVRHETLLIRAHVAQRVGDGGQDHRTAAV